MAHQQLTDRERYQIEALKAEGYRQTEIARSRRRSPSTRQAIPMQRASGQVWPSRGATAEE